MLSRNFTKKVSSTYHIALQMYLSSRSAHRYLSTVLNLPSSSSIKRNLGSVVNVSGNEECRSTIHEVFRCLNDGQKQCILLLDEMYTKPSISYRGGHLLGYAIDDPAKPAKTILAIMLKPMFGAPSFYVDYCLLTNFLQIY